jgi:hypothetical protein
MSWLKNFLAMLATIFFGLVLAVLILEIGLRLVPEAIWKRLIVDSPTRYLLYQTDRNIGWVHIPNAEITWQGQGEFKATVKINSLGLRDYEHTYAKPSGTFRILILGDSFAEGIQVDLTKTLSTQLQACLADRASQTIEVINTGSSAYGPGEEFLFFTHEGVKYQPDLVLVTIYAVNDIKDMGRDPDDGMVQSFGGNKFFLEQDRLKYRWISWADPPEEISPWQRFLRHYSNLFYIFRAPDSRVREEVNDALEEWWPKPTLADAAPQLSVPTDRPEFTHDEYLVIFLKDFPDNPLVPEPAKELWNKFKAVFRELKVKVLAHDAQLATVIIPGAGQVHQEIYNKWVAEYDNKYALLAAGRDVWDMSAPNKAINRFMTQQNIPVLDLLPGFQAYAQSHQDMLYFHKDIHFNEKGHQLAADLMCNWLVENELVPLK